MQWEPYLLRLCMDKAIYNCLAGVIIFTSLEGYMYEYNNIHEIKDYYIQWGPYLSKKCMDKAIHKQMDLKLALILIPKEGCV